MSFLDLLFPPKCMFCGALLRRGERELCTNCLYDLPETDENKPVRFTTGCRAPFLYTGKVRDAILRFKFGNRPFYADALGRFIAEKTGGADVDFVTWVPVSPLRRFGRGYDQAQLLAQAAAARLQLPCKRTLRKKERKKQSKMNSAAARLANVAGAFRVIDPELVREQRILMIDDVCTTGATLSEAALTLRNAGAAEIRCGAAALTEEKKSSR